MIVRQLCGWSLIVVLSLVLSGCAEWGYYRQAAMGQWQMLSLRRDIADLITDPATPGQLQERLELALRVRDFAGSELLLPDNRSYRSYADLGRPYAVWNVVAAPPLSLDPVTWCFPVAGCVPYRGYFDPENAHHFAATLKQQGYDVRVYGVAAYSTLSWFDDPILNTFIYYSEAALAGLIFHELAHQKIYVKNDATFNESFARTVELIGVERWMQQRDRGDLYRDYREGLTLHEEFIFLLMSVRRELEVLYQMAIPAEEKRQGKERILEQFRRTYEQRKQHWGTDRFDGFVGRDLNNADFAQVATYHKYVPALQKIFANQGEDFSRFYSAVGILAQLPAQQRQKEMEGIPEFLVSE